jgi:hypothetical protein
MVNPKFLLAATPPELRPTLLLFELVWFAFAGALFAGAHRAKLEWVKASLAAFAIAILGWRTLGVIPSWWTYFSSTVFNWSASGCSSLSTGKDAVACIKASARDIVAVLELGIAFTGFIVGFLVYQKRFPKQLAPGEPKPESTGGYK